MRPWKRLEGTTQTKVGFRTIVHKQFQMNSGQKIQADIIGPEGNQAAIVIALTPDRQVIIARQFRPGPEQVLDELPGGLVDSGETPEIAARRELAEEVGYASDEMSYLGKAYINTWDNTVHHYFLALNCYPVQSSGSDEFEEIEVDKVAIETLIHNALTANMTDTQGVLLAYDRLKELKGKNT